MLVKLWFKLEGAERKFRRSFGKDIETPSGRFWAHVHYNAFDHAFLRTFWTNFWPVSEGVWRSNQPTHRRFVKYAKMGIKTVVNLRGVDDQAHYLFEKRSCEELGLKLVNVKIWAREAAPRKKILEVLDAVRNAEKPMMFHCKSGADRAGFTAAMYQMVIDGKPVSEAKKQLGLKFIHLDFTKTGVQDFILDVFEARQSLADISFEDWLRTEYEPEPIQKGWDTRSPAMDVAKALQNAA